MRKRKNTGRLLSILLCLMMVLGMFPTAVLAAEDGASAEDSGIITEKKLLREISVVKHVRQTGTEHLRLRPLSLKWRTRLGMRSIPFPIRYWCGGIEAVHGRCRRC